MQYELKDVKIGDTVPEGVVVKGYVQMLYQVKRADGSTKWIDRKARFTEDESADLGFLYETFNLQRED